MYLVDTNIISEARKGVRANPVVRTFWKSINPDDLYLSVVTMGELRRGVENLRHRGDDAQADLLDSWLATVANRYVDRILDFDQDCAQVWGRLMSPHPQHPIDKQIAAIALIHDLVVSQLEKQG
jgi:toxin FitB